MSSSPIWIGAGVVITLILLYNLFFAVFYEHILFQGDSLDDGYSFSFDFEYEEILLSPEPDVKLHGLLLKSDSSKGLILYFHGNRGNLTRWGSIADQIRQHGYDVLVMDYRGYGRSQGLRIENNLYQDAELVYDYAVQKLRYEKIIVHGRSLGSAIATHLAAKREVNHLILETPMTRLREVIPVLDFLLIYKPMLKYEFNSLERMVQITCPVTILHGTQDRVVPYRLGEQLYLKIPHSNKKIIMIDQGMHNNLDTFEAYQQAIGQILE